MEKNDQGIVMEKVCRMISQTHLSFSNYHFPIITFVSRNSWCQFRWVPDLLKKQSYIYIYIVKYFLLII